MANYRYNQKKEVVACFISQCTLDAHKRYRERWVLRGSNLHLLCSYNPQMPTFTNRAFVFEPDPRGPSRASALVRAEGPDGTVALNGMQSTGVDSAVRYLPDSCRHESRIEFRRVDGLPALQAIDYILDLGSLLSENYIVLVAIPALSYSFGFSRL